MLLCGTPSLLHTVGRTATAQGNLGVSIGHAYADPPALHLLGKREPVICIAI